jgi:hypothetical protein
MLAEVHEPLAMDMQRTPALLIFARPVSGRADVHIPNLTDRNQSELDITSARVVMQELLSVAGERRCGGFLRRLEGSLVYSVWAARVALEPAREAPTPSRQCTACRTWAILGRTDLRFEGVRPQSRVRSVSPSERNFSGEMNEFNMKMPLARVCIRRQHTAFLRVPCPQPAAVGRSKDSCEDDHQAPDSALLR